MQYVTDLHLHSKYSRAVSPKMNLQTMAQSASLKGVDVLSAADFTHPVWFKELSEQLVEAEEGLYEVRSGKGVKFLLSTEMSSIYKQGDKMRRIHNLIFMPSLAVAEKFNKAIVARGGNLNADGRPIVGLSSRDLLELLLSIDERSYLIPAHIWTPHFGIYGSASGFDSLEEAFGDLTPHIFGIETGLSSDPDMNWQVPELRNRSILSFSDAHSVPKMGREATVVELESLSFMNIRQAFEKLSKSTTSITSATSKKVRDTFNRIVYTLEFYPEEGKYHFSGHRNCHIIQDPEEIRAGGNMCPVCKKRLTEGVLYRVSQLADGKLSKRTQEKQVDGVKWYEDSMGLQPPFVKLVQLQQIVAESVGAGVSSQKTQKLYTKLCEELTSELQVLLKAPIAEIEKVGGGRVAQAVSKVRAGTIAIEPGYDGVYGKVVIWKPGEEKAPGVSQLKLKL